MARDGISIHVPAGQIFVKNENTGVSLFDFLRNQQDETKKEIPLDFSYDDDYNDYMKKYLPAINEFDEVKHDFISNKTSKYLFHLFNNHQETRGKKNMLSGIQNYQTIITPWELYKTEIGLTL